MVALMYDGLELGRFVRDSVGMLRLHKHKNIPDGWLPYIFNINLNEDMDKIIDTWIKSRVFPKDQLGSCIKVKNIKLVW